MIVIPGLIAAYSSGEKGLEVLVVDESNVVMPYLKSDEDVKFTKIEDKNLDQLKEDFNNLKVFGIIGIPPVDSTKQEVFIETFSDKQMSIDMQGRIKRAVKTAFEKEKIKAYNIPNLDEIKEAIKTDVKINTFQIDEKGEEKASKVEISMAIGYVASFLIYMFIFMFGSMVMRSVIEEKTGRIIEVIVSSVKPFELMMGKILGVASVALLQFCIWIVLTGTIITVAGAVFGSDIIEQSNMQTQITSQVAGTATELPSAVTQVQSQDGINGFLSALKEVNYVQIIFCFVIYFALGYLLYSSLFAAVGAAVDNEADTQQLILPVTMPLIIGLFIMLHTFQYPDSSLSFWGSMIPFTSPMVMMARIAYDVPLWELALSIGLLVVTFIVISYISAKIYRVGILMYGKNQVGKIFGGG
jgi:hypothetical protein